MADRLKRMIKPYDGDLKNRVEDRQHGGKRIPAVFRQGSIEGRLFGGRWQSHGSPDSPFPPPHLPASILQGRDRRLPPVGIPASRRRRASTTKGSESPPEIPPRRAASRSGSPLPIAAISTSIRSACQRDPVSSAAARAFSRSPHTFVWFLTTPLPRRARASMR